MVCCRRCYCVSWGGGFEYFIEISSIISAAYSIRLSVKEKREIQHAFLFVLPSSFLKTFAVILQVLLFYDLIVLCPMNCSKLSRTEKSKRKRGDHACVVEIASAVVLQ